MRLSIVFEQAMNRVDLYDAAVRLHVEFAGIPEAKNKEISNE